MRRNPQGMRFAALMLNLCCCCTFAATHHQCQLRPTNFEGWKAEELSNDWVRLAIVPQLGGRLMQVTFAGHSYLFVNPEYKGNTFRRRERTMGSGSITAAISFGRFPKAARMSSTGPGRRRICSTTASIS